jgi:squalene-associated FAD-dependent desaturase
MSGMAPVGAAVGTSVGTPVAIIGGGYAGMAAAVELSAMGHPVDVYEASRILGGRARAVESDDLSATLVDNGQHILVGAYRETLRLMRAVGADPDHLLKRIPLRFEFPGEFLMSAPRLPAPFHTAFALLGARGLDWNEKWAAIRLMQSLKRTSFRISPDVTVNQWLDQQQTPSHQRRLLWEPLCIAALNTPAERASAQVLANVLRDSLASDRAASDMLLPQVDLSALFPEPAARFVSAHGGAIHREKRVAPLARVESGQGMAWRVNDTLYAKVIVAVAPYHLATLLPDLAAQVEHFEWEPIVTCYLAYPTEVKLSGPMLGVADGIAQWFFDRGSLCGQAGLIAAVISARGRHLDLSAEQLQGAIHGELQRIVPDLPAPLKFRVITEKRATFSCLPGLKRPPADSGLPGLWLAGDYVRGDYPATIEGAVRSGIAAAHLAHQATRCQA